MNKYQAKCIVKISHGEEIETVLIIDEEGMNNEEIYTEALIVLQNSGLKFKTEDMELLGIELRS